MKVELKFGNVSCVNQWTVADRDRRPLSASTDQTKLSPCIIVIFPTSETNKLILFMGKWPSPQQIFFRTLNQSKRRKLCILGTRSKNHDVLCPGEETFLVSIFAFRSEVVRFPLLRDEKRSFPPPSSFQSHKKREVKKNFMQEENLLFFLHTKETIKREVGWILFSCSKQEVKD